MLFPSTAHLWVSWAVKVQLVEGRVPPLGIPSLEKKAHKYQQGKDEAPMGQRIEALSDINLNTVRHG